MSITITIGWWMVPLVIWTVLWIYILYAKRNNPEDFTKCLLFYCMITTLALLTRYL